MRAQITQQGEDYIRDIRDDEKSIIIGPSVDIDILLYLYEGFLDESVPDFKIGMDLKILDHDLEKALDRLERKQYIVRMRNIGR